MNDVLFTTILKALGDNAEVQKAVVAYLKAQTEHAAPDDWVEVWDQLSEEVKPTYGRDAWYRELSIGHPFDSKLYLFARYSKKQGVGVIRAYIIGAKENPYFSVDSYSKPVFEAAVVGTQSEVILRAQNYWYIALDNWEQEIKRVKLEAEENERTKLEKQAELERKFKP